MSNCAGNHLSVYVQLTVDKALTPNSTYGTCHDMSMFFTHHLIGAWHDFSK